MSKARSAARLAAVQALYQLEMEPAPPGRLIDEFVSHRFGATIEDVTYRDADPVWFERVVRGVDSGRETLDALISRHLGSGWSLERIDRLLRQILRAGTFELTSCSEVPRRAVISEYVDVADAFFDAREKGFVNGVLDAIKQTLEAKAP